MLEQKKTHPLIALFGAVALLTSVPAFAQDAAAPAAEAPAAAEAAPAVDAAPAAEEAAPEKEAGHGHGKLTFTKMFMDSDWVVKTVMIGLLIASFLCWVILFSKLFTFASLNKQSSSYLEAFRGARTIADINKISVSEEFEGNPMADMAAVATEEVLTSKQAGLSVSGEHRDSTLARAASGINAVQAGLTKRLSGGQVFLASTGSGGPFIGLFGTVWGIMNSFIGIANTNTTNLAVVAPGIAEALLATGIGLFAAIPAVIMYNYFNTQISAYGTRSEQFVAELLNTVSRQLDKGA